jgi:hypothetical protein
MAIQDICKEVLYKARHAIDACTAAISPPKGKGTTELLTRTETITTELLTRTETITNPSQTIHKIGPCVKTRKQSSFPLTET